MRVMRCLAALACLCVLASAVVAAEPLGGQRTVEPAAHWYKGNTHTHSLWSDGAFFPEQVADWYKSNGYNFLVLSEHNIFAQGERWKDITTSQTQFDVIGQARQRFGNDQVQTRPSTQPVTRPAAVKAAAAARQAATKAAGTSAPAPTAPVEARLRTLAQIAAVLQEEGKFVLIPGEEYSDRAESLHVHMGTVNVPRAYGPPASQPADRTVRETLVQDVQMLRAKTWAGHRSAVIVNHPNFVWALTAEDLAVVPAKFVEVANAHPAVRNMGDATHIGVERMWDIANSLRAARGMAPLYGIGSDDSHTLDPASKGSPGRSWIMVRAGSLDADAIVTAMDEGDYYVSSGVTLRQMQYDRQSGTFSIEIEPQAGAQYTISFIGTLDDANLTSQPATLPATAMAATAPSAGATTAQAASGPVAAPRTVRLSGRYSDSLGKVLQQTQGLKASYKLRGNELYVRAMVQSTLPSRMTDRPQQAWCQPFGWEMRIKSQAAQK